MGPVGPFSVDPSTLDASAETLVELSGRLQAGRPDTSLINRGTGEPRTHPEVAQIAASFTTFAADQYQDAVALLAALSAKLKHTSAAYRKIDDDTTKRMDQFLKNSTLQPFYLRDVR
jgi:hypothetical protein